MKKLLTMLTLVLTLTFCFSLTVLATETPPEPPPAEQPTEEELGDGQKSYGEATGSGESGKTEVGSVDKKDGFLDTKSGYIVYTSDASGNATSDIVAFCWDGGEPYSTTGARVLKLLQTRFNQGITGLDSAMSAPWGYPPFVGGSGNGAAIRAWLLNTPHGGYEKGMDFVMAEVLGFSDAQIFDWYADPENNRLNVEPFIFGGEYTGLSPSTFTGNVIAANTTVWARLVDNNNFGKKYTHKSLPNSCYHNPQVYAQFPPPPDTENVHDSGTILAHAYGIVTVKPTKGVQIVKVYKTAGVVDQTSYGFTEPPVTVRDEGSYKVTKWNTSKTKTKATSIKADYPEVIAGCELVQSGGGPAVVEMPPAEKAIFILLEREKEIAPVVLNQEAIRAHELNYLFRYSDGLRDEFNGKNGRFEGANFKFTDVIPLYEVFDNEPDYLVKNWRTEDKYKVIEDYSGGTAESGRPTHYYKADDLELYHAWGENPDFSITDIVNPHYSVNVSRVWWEDNLHTVEYRDSGMNGYVADVLGITPSLIGEETSANPGSNVENTLPEVQTNTYKYTGKLKMMWDQYNRVGGTDANPIYSSSPKEMEDWIEHEIVEYTMNTYCDKYKVMVTPQASIASAGTFLEEHKSGTILGHDAITVQIEATQLGGTLTFYPEVPMTTWYTSDLVNYAEPENKLVYILGEYPRKCTPPAIHGYTTRVQGGKLTGTTTLPAASTGRVAEDTYSYYADKGTFINGVTAMGTTFETATLNRYEMTIGSVIFDCTDNYGV